MRSVGVAFCGGSRVEEGRPKKKELKEGGGGGGRKVLGES